jgi:cellulose synthase/poly-beta-1,6-N-acetylglucosamine synthase-like glycosyltransferase
MLEASNASFGSRQALDGHAAIDAYDVFTRVESQRLGERSVTHLKRLVTISIPVLNEADNVKPLLERLRAVAASHSRYDFEFLFTDNASTDATFERLADEARGDDRIRVLRFTRNFGFQTSILTNYLNANGAAAIQIDAICRIRRSFLVSFWPPGS